MIKKKIIMFAVPCQTTTYNFIFTVNKKNTDLKFKAILVKKKECFYQLFSLLKCLALIFLSKHSVLYFIF